MSDDFLGDRRKALEESFFAKRDRELLEQLQEKVALEARKEALASASGITNQTVLDELLALNINPETLTALSLAPLVVMAWADGRVDPKERVAVMSAAEAKGLIKESPGYTLLDQWLQHPPGPDLLATWKDYVRELSGQLNDEARASLKNDLIGRARDVAESAGGFLGIGKVSKAEEAVLAELERAFT